MKNQRGFTLIEIIISVALLGLLAFGVTSMLTNMNEQSNLSTYKFESQLFSNGLTRYLQSPSSCQNLVGKTLTATNEELILLGFAGYGVSAKKELKSGDVISKNLTLQSLKFKEKDPTKRVTTQLGTVKQTQTVVQISADIRIKTKAKAYENQDKVIEVPVFIDSTNKIISCIGKDIINTEQICAMAGSIYNPATGLCDPANLCIVTGSYSQLTCSPSKYGCRKSSSFVIQKNDLTNSYSCPAGSVAKVTHRNRHNHNHKISKKSSVTVKNYENYYTCLKCP